MIYLDYNATTPLAPEVLDAMRPYLERHFANASSIHAAGREARAAIDDSRDRLARLLGAKSHEIIFTGGGTESDNLAIIGSGSTIGANVFLTHSVPPRSLVVYEENSLRILDKDKRPEEWVQDWVI